MSALTPIQLPPNQTETGRSHSNPPEAVVIPSDQLAALKAQLTAIENALRVPEVVRTISREELAKEWDIHPDTIKNLELRRLLHRVPHIRQPRYAINEVKRFLADHPAEL
jgi:hypothetical protein